MSDATFSTATNTAGARDFDQIKTTINDFENYKITSDQANQALQQEWNQVKKDGVDTMIIDIFKNSESRNKLVPGFPNLTFQALDQNDYGATFKQQKAGDDQRSVTVDYKNGSLTADSTQYDKQISDKNNKIRSQFLEPINATADEYFAGRINSKTADVQISDEIKSAQADGFNFKSADFADIAATSGDKLHYINLDNGKIGISQSSDDGYAKRIEFDPANAQVKAESFHPVARSYATDIGTSVAAFAAVGAAWGACNMIAGAVPGVAAGAIIGVGIGWGEGIDDAKKIKRAMIDDPTMVFRQ